MTVSFLLLLLFCLGICVCAVLFSLAMAMAASSYNIFWASSASSPLTQGAELLAEVHSKGEKLRQQTRKGEQGTGRRRQNDGVL